MAAKDKAEKYLENYNDVFADIFNTLVFKTDYLKETKLKDGSAAAVYKTQTGDISENIRDIMKHYYEETLLLSSFGIENQSAPDKSMPLRIMGYDYTAYRQQLLNNNSHLTPVISLVLNFSNKRWSTPKSLHELMKIPDNLKPHVQNYCITVIDVAYLEDDIIERFTSDFKIVARFFKDKRLSPQTPLKNHDKTKIKHVEAVMTLFDVFTGDNRFSKAYYKMLQEQNHKGGGNSMCEVLDLCEENGRQKGIIEGKIEGKIEGREETILSFAHDGTISLERAARELSCSVADIQNKLKILKSASALA